MSASVRLIRSQESDFAQLSIPINRGLGNYGSLNFTYRHEYLKTNEQISMTNLFQFYHIYRQGAERQIFTRLDMFCGDRGGCVANRFDTNWIENIGNWQNDLTVSFQPTLINEVLTYQFNPQNQVKVGVYKVLDSFLFVPIIDEGARSDAGDVRGNLCMKIELMEKRFL